MPQLVQNQGLSAGLGACRVAHTHELVLYLGETEW